MALALWVAAESGPVAWLGLDEFDNRPGVFWAYIAAAMRRSGVTVSGTADGPGQRAVRPAALAAEDPPVTLALDDLHVVTEPQVLEGPIPARTDGVLPVRPASPGA
jgi:LuxR family maltose regulon positive regulatory protein